MRNESMNKFILFSVTLFLIILVAGGAAFIFSMRQIIRTNKGNELSQMLEIERLKLEAAVNSEIAIALKLADSPLIKRYFSRPDDTELKKMAFEEIASYRNAFSEYMIFWINDKDRIFYSDDNEPFLIDPKDPVNYWYNMTLHETEVYNFNINYNPEMQQIKLWINAPVFNSENEPIGMVGTGIELTTIVNMIYQNMDERTEFYYFNAKEEITGARNVDLITEKRRIGEELNYSGIDIDICKEAFGLMPDETKTFDVPLGKIALGRVPVLEWYSVVFIHDSIHDFNTAMTALFLVVLALILLIIVVFNVFISGFLKSLQKTMKALEHASKAKSDFLAKMSHEIRTPMNAIIGITEIELTRKENLPETLDGLSKIYSSGYTLLNLINDILDLSKIESGKLELTPLKYETASLINDTVQLNISRIGSKPVDFTLNVSEDLPMYLIGDELRIKQIISNLLSNAFKYTEKGTVTLAIASEARHDEHSTDNATVCLVINVRDTGQGMTPKQVERIFDEYSRFNMEANRATEGTGLGMSITQNLVRIMNGTLTIKSEPGAGTHVTVYLPQHLAQTPITENAVIGKELAERLQNLQYFNNSQIKKLQIERKYMPHGSVLVVDDLEINLFVAKGLMAPYGLKIETAKSGYEALEKTRGGAVYDIVFMDHMMPGMDGIETTKRLREAGYTLPVVALTANAVAGQEDVFLKNGFDGFISKPIDIVELNAILNKFVSEKNIDSGQNSGIIDKNIQSPPAASSLLLIPGIDTAKGIDKVGGSETVYSQLLAMFCESAKERLAQLKSIPKIESLPSFIIHVHSLKSSAALLGAEDISDEAALLETAGTAEDLTFINENLSGFTDRLEKLLKEIDAVIEMPDLRNNK